MSPTLFMPGIAAPAESTGGWASCWLNALAEALGARAKRSVSHIAPPPGTPGPSVELGLSCRTELEGKA